MTYFLTSSPFAPDAPVLSNENGFLERLRELDCGRIGVYVGQPHINWIGSATKCELPVQALIQFAELKDGKIRDISRHCIFDKPIDR